MEERTGCWFGSFSRCQCDDGFMRKKKVKKGLSVLVSVLFVLSSLEKRSTCHHGSEMESLFGIDDDTRYLSIMERKTRGSIFC